MSRGLRPRRIGVGTFVRARDGTTIGVVVSQTEGHSIVFFFGRNPGRWIVATAQLERVITFDADRKLVR